MIAGTLRRVLTGFLMFSGCGAWAIGQEAPQVADATITIPLAEFDQMRREGEVRSVLVIESFSIRGDASQGQLSLQVIGRAAGVLSDVELFRSRNLDGVSGCRGDALLRSHGKTISLYPLAQRFDLECQLHVASSGRIDFEVLEPVLYLETEIENGEVFLQENADGGRRIILSRSFMGSDDTAVRDVGGVARYHLTVEPDMTRFVYQLEFDNPNRTASELTIPMRNQETVRVADGDAVVTEDDDGLRLALAPGANTVRVEGSLYGRSFVPPVEFDEQYLVLEHHPMLRLAFSTDCPRISPGDTGIDAQGRNGRAYLMAGDESVEWTVEKMKVFESQGFTVSDADYLVYVPAFGRAVIEAHFVVDSPGGQELPLVIDGRPSYLEIDGQAQPLYRSEDNQLTVPLAQGTQSVTVQYRTERRFELFEVLSTLPLVGVNAPISTASIALRVHSKWRLLGATFSRSLWSPVRWDGFLIRLVLSIGLCIVFARTGFSRAGSLGCSTLLFLLSVWNPLWFALPLIAIALILYLRLDPSTRISRILRGSLALATLVVVALVAVGVYAVRLAQPDLDPDLLSGTQRISFANAVGHIKKNEIPDAVDGAPARIDIPARGREIRFWEDMIPVEEDSGVKILVAPKVGLDAVSVLLVAVLGGLLWRIRQGTTKRFRELWKEYRERLAQDGVQAA